METGIIFPHQLFEDHPVASRVEKIFLVEEHLFFNQYKFHQQKLVFHRASVKAYERFLQNLHIQVEYIEATSKQSDVRRLIQDIETECLHFVDPVDDYLRRRIIDSCLEKKLSYTEHSSPSFLNTTNDLADFFNPKKKKFFQTEFYKRQRLQRNVLIDSEGNPEGGQWTFDQENRKRYPARSSPPSIAFPDSNSIYEEAIAYVKIHFGNNPGRVSETPIYPFNFESSKKWLDEFLDKRFLGFGDYEDALVASEHFLHHSLLSPLINCGLLLPAEVVGKLIKHAEVNDIPINNTEGIIRQIIGWREFIRGIYVVKGSEERTKNFWGFKRKIPISFYKGTTGIPPIDITIKKLLKTGYNHHIERLMVLGNFMLLCEFDPDEVYRWFMEMYIDAYDWVMVPNVYGMSQFADGGLMSTKPYISGSNYLMKMGDYPKGDWQKIWDGLFWRFMHIHRDFFLSNPRLGMLIRTFDKMSEDKKSTHLSAAEEFLEQL